MPYNAIRNMRNVIPVIDLFAGPGGLGEGFSSYRPAGRKNRAFRIELSVEKDPFAHQTLFLRAFYRAFGDDIPEDYFDYLRGRIERVEDLYSHFKPHWRLAKREALLQELGVDNPLIYDSIERRLQATGGCPWVLIGGPPCQAYSLVGRSRTKGAMEHDERQVLYQEYLSILARFRPAVFVMENVKGLLSSSVKLNERARPDINGSREQIFVRILRDLKNPVKAIYGEYACALSPVASGLPDTYRIYSLVEQAEDPDRLKPTDFIIRAEEYGVPQTRHRVIMVGVREDITRRPGLLVKAPAIVPVEAVLRDLPPLRSQLSKRRDQERDSPDAWRNAIQTLLMAGWLDNLKTGPGTTQLSLFSNTMDVDATDFLRGKIIRAALEVRHDAATGSRFMERVKGQVIHNSAWYYNRRFSGICNHESRAHMQSDLHRYLFLACYAAMTGASPTIRSFPDALLPAHDNLRNRRDNEEDVFDDRFRVQVAGKPATTITAHISKDGHYNIHYDPSQCRSLTVREAARIQTFPDDYFFEGPRTEQYRQIGNAVPPYLAHQIARIVYGLLESRK